MPNLLAYMLMSQIFIFPIFFEALARFYVAFGFDGLQCSIMASPLSLRALFQKLGSRCVTFPFTPHVLQSLSRSSANWHGPIVKACTFDHSTLPLLLYLQQYSYWVLSVGPQFLSPFLLCPSLTAEARKRKTT